MVDPDWSLSADEELRRGIKPFSHTFDAANVSRSFVLGVALPFSPSEADRLRMTRRR